MAGLLGSIEAYNSMSDLSTYKGLLEFYLQINKITDAAMKRAAPFTQIGNASFRMLTDLHFSTKLIDFTYKAIIEDLDKANGKKVSKMASRVRFGTVLQHEGQNIDEFFAMRPWTAFRRSAPQPPERSICNRSALRPHQE